MTAVKLLILLVILASFKLRSSDLPEAQAPQEVLQPSRGPVFNPLRTKPYTKVRANA